MAWCGEKLLERVQPLSADLKRDEGRGTGEPEGKAPAKQKR